jgi:hypothetical protein
MMHSPLMAAQILPLINIYLEPVNTCNVSSTHNDNALEKVNFQVTRKLLVFLFWDVWLYRCWFLWQEMLHALLNSSHSGSQALVETGQ